jgi:hypothetical protein
MVATREGIAVDLAIVSRGQLLHAATCEWLVFATYKGTPVAWSDGAPVGSIVGPPGFSFSPSRTTTFFTEEEARNRLVYLRTENAVDVYRDKQTGEEVYVGRAAGK